MPFVTILPCELVLVSAVESIYDQIMSLFHRPSHMSTHRADTSAAAGSWHVSVRKGEGAAGAFARLRFGLPAPPKRLPL